MNEATFLSQPFREQVRAVVERVETQTGAEVVVSVRPRCGSYEGARHLLGGLCGLAMLLMLLFHPMEFSVRAMPSAVVVAHLLGYVAAGRSPRSLRWLTPRRVREAQVRVASRAAFHELGVVETRRRVGVLVFVSLLEQRVEVVCDRGVDSVRAGASWERVVHALREAVVRHPEPPAFLEALAALGPVLGAIVLCSEDDSDELPNLPSAAPEESS